MAPFYLRRSMPLPGPYPTRPSPAHAPFAFGGPRPASTSLNVPPVPCDSDDSFSRVNIFTPEQLATMSAAGGVVNGVKVTREFQLVYKRISQLTRS